MRFRWASTPSLTNKQPSAWFGRKCPVLPLVALLFVILWQQSSDLAERREVQSCQGTMEHVPHCSQQLEASKHLVKEMREWLLQGERW